MRSLSPEAAGRLAEAPLSNDRDAVGYRRIQVDLPVDGLPAVALERLLTWQMHEGAGIRVQASAPRVSVGVVAVLQPGLGRLRLAAPVRVVAVHLSGFTYGTLPGHPESGEERFEIVPDADRCRLVVTGFSRPGRMLTRLAGPLAPRLQQQVVQRYARALGS